MPRESHREPSTTTAVGSIFRSTPPGFSSERIDVPCLTSDLRISSSEKEGNGSPSLLQERFQDQEEASKSSSSPSNLLTILDPSAIHPNMATDELVKKLMVISTALQSMKQEEVEDEDFLKESAPFCIYLANEDFLNHSCKSVQVLVACCLVDILRIYAPEAPFKEPGQIKSIFTFLINQLKGLKNVKDIAFKRYYHLLDNLTSVRCFALCFDLGDEDAQNIFVSLFEVVFSSVNDNHSERVRSVMIDLLSTILVDFQAVSYEILDVILKHLLEPIKTSRKMAYQLAKEVIIKCSKSLEPSIRSLLNEILTGSGKMEVLHSIYVAHQVYDVIYELHNICPSIVQTVLPQLEYKLKKLNEKDRLEVVALLAKIFSEKGSESWKAFHSLWIAFLGRFNDVSVAIRTLCVQHAMHFLLNHVETRKDIEDKLCRRLHDSDEQVRLEVVRAVVATATNGGFEYISGNPQLLDCLKERTMDKKPKIRYQALQGLAQIYKIHLENFKSGSEGPPVWMHNRIMRGYYVDNTEDRTLIEKLFKTCLVPYNFDVNERMIQLMYLWSTGDMHTAKAFIEMQKNLFLVRAHAKQLLEIVRSPSSPERLQSLNQSIVVLSKFLPNPGLWTELISRFVKDLEKSANLQDEMELILDPKSDCRTVVDNVGKLLKRLGPPIMTNIYHGKIEILLERASSVLIDKEAILVLLKLVSDLVNEEKSSQDNRFTGKNFPATNVIIEKTCNLISILACLYHSHFNNRQALEALMKILLSNNLVRGPSSAVLSAFACIGKTTGPLDLNVKLMKALRVHCLSLVDDGSPRQAKMAIRCLHLNIGNESMKKITFAKMLAVIQRNLEDPSSNLYPTAVVALGHFALLMPTEFKLEVKVLIKENIVKGLLMNPERTPEDSSKNLDNEWCEEEDLPKMTRCMVNGMKTLIRWLVGLQTEIVYAQKSMKLLIAFVQTGGTFCEKNSSTPFSNSEKAWLRLSAGCAFLKLSHQKIVGDQYNASQFCSLAQLMNDDVEQVRFRFAEKVHKGLNKGVPNKCLPLDFLGFYVLGGFELNPKHQQTLKHYMRADIKVRRDYINKLMLNHPDKDKVAEHLPYLQPDYMFAFAVSILANNPHFTSHKNVCELKKVQRCLQFVLEPLLANNESISVSFLKKLCQGIKNRRNAADLENEDGHFKMYAVCDIAFGLLMEHNLYSIVDSPIPVPEPKISRMYFEKHDDGNWINSLYYLPTGYIIDENAPKTAKENGPAATAKMARGKQRGRKRTTNDQPEMVDDNNGNVYVTIDADPTDAKRTRLVMEELSEGEIGEGEGESTNSREFENTDAHFNSEGRNQQQHVLEEEELTEGILAQNKEESIAELQDQKENESLPPPQRHQQSKNGRSRRFLNRPPTPAAIVVKKRRKPNPK